MDKKKKYIVLMMVFLILLIVLILWISGLIPKQIARIYGSYYLEKNYPKLKLEYVDIEDGGSMGDYHMTFKDENNQIYHFMIGPKYFPIVFGQGMVGFEEEYRLEFTEITDINDFYNHKVTKEYKDIRTLPEKYSKEQAQRDNCFVVGAMVHNDYLYSEFMDKYNEKNVAFIRIVQSTTEGDAIITDILYHPEKDIVYIVKDNTRDKFSAQEDRKIEFKEYEKIGIWKYRNSEYWVAYNGNLPNDNVAEDAINSGEVYVITTIN